MEKTLHDRHQAVHSLRAKGNEDLGTGSGGARFMSRDGQLQLPLLQRMSAIGWEVVLLGKAEPENFLPHLIVLIAYSGSRGLGMVVYSIVWGYVGM